MKKLFTYVVVVATIVSTLGLAAVVPGASAAYSATAGDKIKVANGSAVYYIGDDMKRHLFSNEVTYWTWFSGSWSGQGVKTITQSELDAIGVGANVVARPGTDLVKFDNSPKVYVVSVDGMLYSIDDATRTAWFPGKTPVTIQSSFEANYTKSSSTLTSSSKLPDGSLIKYQGSDTIYLVWDGKKRQVTDEGFTANNFKNSAVVTVPTSMTYDTGSSVTGKEAAIWDVDGVDGGSNGDGGVITTPGAEGTITVTVASKPAGDVEIQENQDQVTIMGIDIEANQSDVLVQRVKIAFATTSSKVWKDILDNLYIFDGSTQVAKVNIEDVVDEDDDTSPGDSVTVSGFSILVKKDQTKTLTIKADTMSTIDSVYENSSYDFTMQVPANGVRAIDGAGIDIYGPDSAISKTFNAEQSSADQASLVLSLSTGNPGASQVIASTGSNEDERDLFETLRFNLKAEDDDVLITDLTATTTNVGAGAATATTAYLYRGSDLVDSATINSSLGSATFDDIDETISEDTTATFSIKVDIEDANATKDVLTTSITSGGVVAENSDGDSITASGSATGEGHTVYNKGPEVSLVSSSISKSQQAQQNNTTTSTVTAVFNVKVKAVGGDVIFGNVSSAAPAFGTSSTYFKTYRNGSSVTLLVASSTSYNAPSTGVVTSGYDNSFAVQEGNEVTIPVTYIFEGRDTSYALLTLGAYAVGLEGMKWYADGGAIQTTNFMAGELEWRTSEVQLP